MKCLILALTLLLITATAALIGTNVQTETTLELKKNEKVEVSSKAESQTVNSEELIPPRFILNEPIENYLEEQSDIVDPSAAVKDSQESGIVVTESEPNSSQPSEPDDMQIKKTSEPYLKEIFNIKNNAFGNISSLEKKIAVEFLTIPKNERKESVKKLTEKYLPQVSLIMTTADDDVDRACSRLKAALAAIGANSTIADEAKETYKKERDQKIEYYEKILKSFGEEISIDEEAANSSSKKEEGSGV